MNIVVISRGIPSKRDAQWGGFEFDQAKALANMGHKVIVASVDTRFRFYWRSFGLTEGEKNGIKTYNMFFCPTAVSGLLGRKFKEYIMRRQWLRMVEVIHARMEHVDVIYAHYLFNAYYAVQCMQSLHAPVVAMEHWSALNREPIAKEVVRMADYTYPRLAQLLAVSQPLKERIQNRFGIPATVVHNMVGKEFKYTASQPNKLFTFITVGSLFPVKNHALLVSALAKLNLPQKEWQLIIVGEGKERIPLQAQIAGAGLSDNIHLVGLKDKQTIAQLLNSSHVFVLPSRSENFSVAVLEALACGLPVVASICGGIRECIDDKNGLLFEVDDTDGLAQCLKYMFEHYGNYNRKAIADDCLARFSPEIIAGQLKDIFETIKS